MHRFTAILLVFLVVGFAANSVAQQFRGQVVNRDGVPQRCQLEFLGNGAQFRANTDAQGYFYVQSPRLGGYRVVVSQGQARNEFEVGIDSSGLHPSTLVVRW